MVVILNHTLPKAELKTVNPECNTNFTSIDDDNTEIHIFLHNNENSPIPNNIPSDTITYEVGIIIKMVIIDGILIEFIID